MKKIIFTILVVFMIFIIYIFNVDKKVYYVNISDDNLTYSQKLKNKLKKENKLEKYINYTPKDYRITDLINDINSNKLINNNQSIQNALIKADILTLKIGNNELNYKVNTNDINELFDYSDELIKDIEELFKIIRKYDKEKIYFIGYEEENNTYYNEIYKYINVKIKDICQYYNIKFIKKALIIDKNNIKIN